ncbi:rhombosortase [Thalassotalea sp. Y01]|uniref:rhombosortase n=1 Tax=Thalassotalea sp. Y01 TaxID=2729613 RepID=UPI00145FAA86|nr:rhombosortase [Thalassotalea sp. Y01]NMP16753.1 rhombosortase [Thalassotalea sp. Y01]
MLKLSLPTNRQAWLLPAIVFVIAVIIHFLPKPIIDQLIYHRDLIAQGEWWRLLTGHFAHTNTNHLLLNLAGLTMLWALHGEHYRHHTYAISITVAALVCSIGMYFLSPDTVRYVGLSGVLHGIFVWGAIKDIHKGWRSGYLLLIGVWAKIAYEQLAGSSADVEKLINARVAIEAHLYGAIGGLLLPLWERVTNRHKPEAESE